MCFSFCSSSEEDTPPPVPLLSYRSPSYDTYLLSLEQRREERRIRREERKKGEQKKQKNKEKSPST